MPRPVLGPPTADGTAPVGLEVTPLVRFFDILTPLPSQDRPADLGTVRLKSS
jgi:hypothetical protein